MDGEQQTRFNDALQIAARILNVASKIVAEEIENDVPKGVPSGPGTFIKEGELPNGF